MGLSVRFPQLQDGEPAGVTLSNELLSKVLHCVLIGIGGLTSSRLADLLSSLLLSE